MSSVSLRTRFDAVLRDNIRRLLDTMPEAASLPFDIATITSLILLVEKEKEIEAFPQTVFERYSENTLLEGLADTGLEIDEDSRGSIRELQGMGFVAIDGGGHFVPRKSTEKLVTVLDNLFPGMPGMNLVAYFLQTVEEAASGRKEIDQAVRQFEQTLISRGIPLSKSNQPRGKAAGPANGGKPSDKIDNSRRVSSLERLRRIRSSQNSRFSEVSSARPLTEFQKAEVVSLFPTATAAPDPACEQKIPPLSTEQNDAGNDPEDLHRRERSDPIVEAAQPDETSETDEIEPATSEAAIKEDLRFDGSQPPSAGLNTDAVPFGTHDPNGAEEPDSHDPIEDSAAISAQEPSVPGVSTEDIVPPEAESKDLVQDKPIQMDDSEEGPVANEEIVDLHVAQFQQALAMTCPLCREGIIHPSKTDKGKIYYSCENRDCNFISWGKPYHFTCPYCRNSFLVECITRDGLAGLKCPKATCNYRQEHLDSPHSETVKSTISPVPGTAPRKGKILVRKRLVRRKR